MIKKEKLKAHNKKHKKSKVISIALLTVAVCSCIPRMCEKLTNCAYKKMK